MLFKLLIVLLCIAAVQLVALQMVATKIECEFDKNLLNEAACSMTPIPSGGSIVQLSGTFSKDAEKIWIFHGNYEKEVGRNKYKPGIMKATIDLCDFNNAIRGTLINRFIGEATKGLKEFVHPCPYRGSVNMTNIRFTGSLYLKFLRQGSYRFDYRLFDDKNGTYFYVKYYANVKPTPK